MKRKLLLAALATAVLTGFTYADEAEIEPNDTWATAQNLSSGELVATGSLGPTELLRIADENVALGTVNTYTFGIADGLAAGTSYNAITAAPSAGGGQLDSRLGWFDSAGTTGTLLDDADGFPGETLAVATDAGGDLHLAVTHWQDTGYTGAGVAGDYDLVIATADNGFADFFKFSGLSAGSSYTATTDSFNGGNPDTIMGLYDATGTQILFDDDGAATGLFSEFTFTADASGMAWIAVSGFEGFGDTDFSGDYTTSGEYSLTLVRQIPEPGSMVVLGLVGLVGLVRRKRA